MHTFNKNCIRHVAALATQMNDAWQFRVSNGSEDWRGVHMDNFIKNIVGFDMSTLMQVLVWGNISFLTLSFIFVRGMERQEDRELLVRFLYAKLAFALGWLLLTLRGGISDTISINVGNTLIFIGFYLESYTILALLKTTQFNVKQLLFWITIGVAVSFNVISLMGVTAGARIGFASLFAILLWLPSALTLSIGSDRTYFNRFLGVAQLLLCFIFVPRMMMGFNSADVGLLTNNAIQSVSFLTLVLHMLINSSGFLLLIYQAANLKLENVAKLDPLTRVRNRRAFIEVAEPIFTYCQRNGSSIAILFIDLDHFKRVNDTYGHAMGDLVLIETAALMEESLRGSDILCRYGGEEFVILLPDTTQETGMIVAERIRQRVADATYSDGTHELRITVSIGFYSGIPGRDDSLLKFVDRSDESLYKAKQEGRNRICVERKD